MERIRKATSADAEFIAKMVIMALHMEKEGEEGERLLRHITELVMDEGSLYHWSRAVVIDGVGACVAYDGADYHPRRVRSFSFVCSDGLPVVEDNSSLLAQPDETQAGEYYIDSLAIMPEYRGKGYGRLFLQHAVKEGTAIGLVPYLLVDPANTGAVRLYTSLGFEGESTLHVFSTDFMKMKYTERETREDKHPDNA